MRSVLTKEEKEMIILFILWVVAIYYTCKYLL